MKIGYARVSTGDQDETLQVDALRAAGCEKIFTDKGSGATFDRKGLNEAMNYARSGDAFVVWKLDRLGRSLIHLIEILNMLHGRGVEFVSITEHIDTTTPGGKLIFHLMGALAEFERALIRERTQAGLAVARAKGHVSGRPRKLRNGKLAQAYKLFNSGDRDIDALCETLDVSRATLYRYIKEQRDTAIN